MRQVVTCIYVDASLLTVCYFAVLGWVCSNWTLLLLFFKDFLFILREKGRRVWRKGENLKQTPRCARP